jgi:hypothetical protein
MNLNMISMESLAGILSPWVRRVSLDDLAKISRQVGANGGVEFFPIKCSATEEILKGKSVPGAQQIKAAYQSWRSERNIWMLLEFFEKHWSNPKLCYLALVSFFLVVERRESMAHLVALQNLVSEIPMVIYPHHAGIIDGQRWDEKPYPEFIHLSNKLVQPEPGLLREDRWGVTTPEEFRLKAMEYGFDGFCLSGHVIEAWPENWQRAVETFLPETKLLRLNPEYELSQDLLQYMIWLEYDEPVVLWIRARAFMSRKVFEDTYVKAVRLAQQLESEE